MHRLGRVLGVHGDEMSAKTITEWQRRVYATAASKGWHREPLDIWTALGNIHAEVSEAWEEARKPGYAPKLIYLVEGKPEGLAIELADIVMRVMNATEALGIDLQRAMEIKDAYNATQRDPIAMGIRGLNAP